MKCLIHNKKGGQGKSTLAVLMAHRFGLKFITNDEDNEVLETCEALLVKGGEVLTGETDLTQDGCIYDFGGFADATVLEVAENADLVIVPMYYRGFFDLNTTLKSMNTIADKNDNIVFILNGADKKDTEEAMEYFKQEQPDLKVFPVNYSKRFGDIPLEGKTIFQMAEEDGLIKYQTKTVRKQLTDIFNYIKEHYYGQ